MGDQSSNQLNILSILVADVSFSEVLIIPFYAKYYLLYDSTMLPIFTSESHIMIHLYFNQI